MDTPPHTPPPSLCGLPEPLCRYDPQPRLLALLAESALRVQELRVQELRELQEEAALAWFFEFDAELGVGDFISDFEGKLWLPPSSTGGGFEPAVTADGWQLCADGSCQPAQAAFTIAGVARDAAGCGSDSDSD